MWISRVKASLKATTTPTTQDIAWVAGIHEGEGSVRSTDPRGSPYGIVVTIGQKDDWLLQQCKELFGGTITYSKFPSKMIPVWQISGARARGFCMTIYKFLSPRRKNQIDRFLKGDVDTSGLADRKD